MADYIIHIDSAAAGGGDGSIATPYNALSSINWTTAAAAITAGSIVNINLKKGSMWRELLTLGAAGATGRQLVIQSYGATGAKPVINGANILSGWTASGAGLGSTWQATCGSVATTVFMVNHVFSRVGASATTLNNGEWYQSGTTMYFRWDAANPDTAGLLIEQGQRSCIVNNNRAYIKYDGLELRYANASGIDNQNTTSYQTFMNLLFTDCYYGLGYRGVGGVMQFCEFVRGGAGAAQIAAVSDSAGTLDMSYCVMRDSYARHVRTQYGAGFTYDNCVFVGSKLDSIHNTVNTANTMRNCIVSGCGGDGTSVVIQSTAGTFTVSDSIIGLSMNGAAPTGVTYGSNVRFIDPQNVAVAYDGLLSWSTDDGNYIYARNMGDALRAASAAFEGATVGDYNTQGITGARQTFYQAMVAAGDEIAGHGRHGTGAVTTLDALKLYCSNYGTSTTVTVSVAANVLTTAVNSVTDLTLDLTAAAYDTLAELVAYLNGRAGAAGVVYASTIASAAHNTIPSTVLADISGVNIRVGTPGAQLSADSTKYWTEEIVNARTDIETAVGGGYTAPTFIYPQGSTSAALISFLKSNNFVGGRTASATNMSTYLRNLDLWNVYGITSTGAHGLLAHLTLQAGLTDTSGNSYTFTGVNLGAYASNLYFRLPTDFGGSANLTSGTAYFYRAALAKLDYRTADWSVGMLARPTRLTGAETYTLFYHGDTTGTDNYTRLWISADGALHYSIVVAGVESVRLDSAAGIMVVNQTKAVSVRQFMGKIELLAGSGACTDTKTNVLANTLLATVTTDVVPGAGAASYTGAVIFGTSSDGAGGFANYYYGYISDMFMGQNTARLAAGMCAALTSMGQYVIFMHHADVPYELIKTYADVVAWYNANVGTVRVKTIKSAMQYLLDNGTLSSDGLRIRYEQTDATNLQPQAASPARNAGADLGYTVDIAGTAIVAPPDIGAYEYVATGDPQTITFGALNLSLQLTI